MSSSQWQQLSDKMLRQAGLALDWSRMDLPPSFFEDMAPRIQTALQGMKDLEKGDRVNKSEKRRVGHYWLRGRGPTPPPEDEPDIEAKIKAALDDVKAFARHVVGKSAEVKTQGGKRFKNLLLIGIGGSALGPQLLADAFGPPGRGYLEPYFFDNTDPDGMDRTLEQIGSELAETLTIAISKSGTTPETLNGLAEAARAYRAMGLDFAEHAVAITMVGKDVPLLERAGITKWRKHFPIWDWVGGRTSLTSAVGLLPAALMGIPIEKILQGAAEMDAATRREDPRENMALLLALCWHHATKGRGEKDMVILPYKDRLILLSRYLQQLIMESLGKEKVCDGEVIHQGIAVYGNKGSTDQHSYVQQLRDGVPNFFATFIQVLKDRHGPSIDVDSKLPGITSGDFLLGFLLGTRQALFEKGRESLTLTLDELTPRAFGSLVALYERAVGYYAGLVDINAYDQPGVQAGKLAAVKVIQLQARLLAALPALPDAFTAEQAAAAIQPPPVDGQEKTSEPVDVEPVDVETVWKLLEHLAVNSTRMGNSTSTGDSGSIGCRRGKSPAEDEFFKKS